MTSLWQELMTRLDRKHQVSILYLFLFSMALAVMVNFSWQELPSSVDEGEIATHDIRADNDYEIIDKEATEKSREEVMSGILPVYNWESDASGLKVVADRSSLTPWLEKGILVKTSSDKEAVPLKDFKRVVTLEEAQQLIKKGSLREKLRVNFFYNEEETLSREREAAENFQEVVVKVQRGQSIIRSGDRFGPWHVKVINGIRHEKAKHLFWEKGLGTFLFTFLFLSLFFFVGQKVLKGYRIVVKDLVFQGILLMVILLMERLFFFFSIVLRGVLPFEISQEGFYAMIPVAAGAMIVRLVLSLPSALFFALVSSIFAGIILENSLLSTLYYLSASVFGSHLVAHARSRVTIWSAGIGVGILNVALLGSFDLMNATSLEGLFAFREFGTHVLCAFAGGLMTAGAVLILTPLVEFIFNYVSEMKLLELGSMNHPLLRQLIMQAPGTYHHSHMVGTLAEAACESIGADSLFARVACYFHDIGKMRKPSYFIENMAEEGDRHSQLSPSMSALIISSHVKDGMELAREYKLPTRIIDIIPQHQGTKLISYFYSRAKEQEDPAVHVVDENEYRYPGPRPQTPEAGVILLADTVEAATRALKDRSPARLEEVVRNMINKNFIDGQLDECELTLKDLHAIANSFVRILMGIYHQRVEYPELPEKEGSSGGSEQAGDKYTQSKPLSEASLQAAKVPPANLHRLGDKRRN